MKAPICSQVRIACFWHLISYYLIHTPYCLFIFIHRYLDSTKPFHTTPNSHCQSEYIAPLAYRPSEVLSCCSLSTSRSGVLQPGACAWTWISRSGSVLLICCWTVSLNRSKRKFLESPRDVLRKENLIAIPHCGKTLGILRWIFTSVILSVIITHLPVW